MDGDPFETALFPEDRYLRDLVLSALSSKCLIFPGRLNAEGYSDGYGHGCRQGRVEGYSTGHKQGVEIGSEVSLSQCLELRLALI